MKETWFIINNLGKIRFKPDFSPYKLHRISKIITNQKEIYQTFDLVAISRIYR